MNDCLTENELKINIYSLKNLLDNINLKDFEKISFINLLSLYNFIDTYYSNPPSISHIMSILEPYIPLSLCVESNLYDLMISAMMSENENEIAKIKSQFHKKAVFEFLKALKNAETDFEVEYIFNLCNNLRLIQSI